jgi:hypothetical protein
VETRRWLPVRVHVGELHTDVVSGGPSSSAASDGGAAPAGDLEEHLAEVRSRAESRERRVAAEGFDD